MSNKVNKEAFQALYKTARDSHEEAVTSSPLFSRASKRVHDAFQDTFGKATNAAEVVAKKAKLKFKVFDKEDESQLDVEKVPSVHTVVNWFSEVVKDIIDKVNEHGDILAFLLAQVSKTDTTETRQEDYEDLKVKHEELEKKTKDMEERLTKKCDELENDYDEARQRSLKGNLIISSPARTNARGNNIPSLAKHQVFWDRYGNQRCETDLEMVLRLVHMKTGVRINEHEVTACHPLGKRDRNTFILSVHNRTPMSAWETITRGMTADNNFSPDNIFINFQLTKRRGEMSKEVRLAKKQKLIRGYEIDANGRIFVRKIDNEETVEIIKMADIKAFFSDN